MSCQIITGLGVRFLLEHEGGSKGVKVASFCCQTKFFLAPCQLETLNLRENGMIK